MRRYAALLLLVSACGQPAAVAPRDGGPTIPPAASASPAAKATFPRGLYVVRPSLDRPGGTVELLEGAGPLPVKVDFVGHGYDVSDDVIVAPTPRNDGLVLHFADGSRREVRVNGLYAIARPSLSPDGKLAAVQATETPISPASPMPRFLTIYVIDLASGAFRRLVAPGTQDIAEGRELPRWSPRGDRILYQTNDLSAGPPGCNSVRVVDAAGGTPLLAIGKDGPTGCFTPTAASGPRFHAEFGADGSRILIPGQLQLYDAASGQLLADVRRQALEGLAAAGYRPDARFPGQAGAGTFPLAGSLSPDGRSIAFDGAVEKDGVSGVILCRINVDGSGFGVLRAPVRLSPMFSNEHNFSQLLPRWR